MRSAAIRHPGHVSRKRFVRAAFGLALLAAVALIAVRGHAQRRDSSKAFVRESQAERERLMAWTAVGASADPPPAPPAVTARPNQSLPTNLVSLNTPQPDLALPASR
jgi:hypothetical protein